MAIHHQPLWGWSPRKHRVGYDEQDEHQEQGDCGRQEQVHFDDSLHKRGWRPFHGIIHRALCVCADNYVSSTRRALYMPALVAVRHDPHGWAFYEHLQARGKTKLQALVATMRKLLHAIFGMFKHDQLFDGAKVNVSANADLAPVSANSGVA